MENIFKQFVYTGVGLASLSSEKFQEFVNRLIDEGKVKKEEGKKIVDEFLENTESKKDELETQFSSLVEKIMKSFKFATTKDINVLINRVTVLEAMVANKKQSLQHTETDETKKKAKSKKTE